MQWIINNSTDPAFNLALEEYFLQNIPKGHEGYGIFWQNKPCIVVGRFQNAYQEINEQYLCANNIDVVRRITGGGAVYHDFGTLNYTFIHYLGDNRHFPVFSDMGKPMANALQSMGLQVEFSGRNDLMLHGVKVAGLAHCFQKKRCLHHGCILVDTDLEVLSKALNVDPSKYITKGIQSVRQRVGNLAEHFAQEFPHEPRLTPAFIRDTITANLPADSFYSPSYAELMEITRLRDEKYASWEWIYGASPQFTEQKSKRFSWGKVEFLFTVVHGYITECHIFGDFFSGTALHEDDTKANFDIAKLEKALCGIKYTAKELARALKPLPLETIFHGCDVKELKEFIVNG